MSAFIVHGVPSSTYVQAVLITLAEKGGTAIMQPLPPTGLKAGPYLSRHPFGKMPVLEHGDFALYETQAILRYLDRLIPAPALTPTDIRRASRMDQVMNITDQYLMNDVTRVIGFQRLVGPLRFGLETDLTVIAEAMPRVRTVLGVLDEMLAGQQYFAGDDVSLADILVVPHLNMLTRTPEWTELSKPTARLIAWATRMNDRPSVRTVDLKSLVPKAA